jgi:hypothetical protein
MDTGERPLALPEEGSRDDIYRVVRATVGAVPAVGSFLQEILDVAVGQPALKARDEFLRDLADRVHALGIKVEELAQNRDFGPATVAAIHIAMRTAQSEKREYLRNALLHVATGRLREDDVALILPLIDALSLRHIVVLDDIIAQSPGPDRFPEAEAMRFLAVWARIKERFPRSAGQDERGSHSYFKSVVADLEGRGLIEKSFYAGDMQENRGLRPAAVARALIEYIKAPAAAVGPGSA